MNVEKKRMNRSLPESEAAAPNKGAHAPSADRIDLRSQAHTHAHRVPCATAMEPLALEGLRRLLAPLATIPACQTRKGEADWFPPVDILEEAEHYLFKVDLPEVKPADIRGARRAGHLWRTPKAVAGRPGLSAS